MSTAAVMGGISRISRCKEFEDRRFEPVSLGRANYLFEGLPNLGRFIELALPAFEESLEPLKKIKPDIGKIPVFVGLPKARPGLARSVDPGSPATFEFSVIREDHDSGLIALHRVWEQMQEGTGEFFLIGGVESYVSEETIAWLEKERLLKCSSNRIGFVPGEAASFCLLCSPKAAEKYKIPVPARIVGCGTSIEMQLPGSERPSTGAAFTGAVRKALAQLPEGETVSEVICTLKGQRHEADEFAYGNLAIGPRLAKPGEYLSLVSRWGDIGAASAPALIGFATIKRKLGFSPPAYTLVFTMSPGGSRSATLIRTT
jgi:3-oxoacyl-[acyl-carrier-protein] synthase-1